MYDDLRRFRNIHQGETCVIIGNGPSLDKTDLFKLDHYVTFGSNRIFDKPFTPYYYCIIDKRMMRSCLPLPESFYPVEMFIRAEAGVGNPIYPIVASGFSLDINNFIVMGGTVTYALLQIAFYMGFSLALLVGVDHYYPSADTGSSGVLVGKNTDPDHFTTFNGDPYFQEGREYNRPELEGSAKGYAIAREVYEKTGRRILNLTIESHLDVFEKDEVTKYYA